MSKEGKSNGSAPPPLDEDIARRILDAIRSLHFGAVEVTIHEGRVVQIDRRERTRITSTRD